MLYACLVLPASLQSFEKTTAVFSTFPFFRDAAVVLGGSVIAPPASAARLSSLAASSFCYSRRFKVETPLSPPFSLSFQPLSSGESIIILYRTSNILT